MKLFFAAALIALTPAAALASGSHAGGHGDEAMHDEMMVGRPGDAADVDRTIEIVMKETDDGDMLFEPKSLSITVGETIRFHVTNSGELEHEFVLDQHEEMMEHKAMMEKFPEMEHNDPNAIRLAEQKDGDVIWTFTNAGEFEFGCLIPGHYEAGMKGTITVAAK